VRKRPILLAAGALAAGLAALGTVGAQPPSGYGQTTRSYADWTPSTPGYPPPSGATPAGGYLPPPAGYTQQGAPQGGQAQTNRPRLTNPVVAGADGVRQARYDIPPPSMDIPAAPGTGAASPATPPGVSSDPFPPLPLVPVPPAGPLSLAIPAGGGSAAGVPAPPSTFPPLPGTGADKGDNPPAPGASSARLVTPTPTPAPSISGLPGRVSQNVTIETICPETVVFGQEFRYELIVRNAGNAAVAGVRVEDELPAGAKYIGSDPPAEMTGDRLSWSFVTLEAAGEKRIVVRVRPTEEGEVRSRATVTFCSAVDARTKVTRPRVSVSMTGSEVCRAGEETVFQIKVTNSGSGPAQRMVLQARLSDGLLHPQGMVIEAELANLPPGETKTVPLKVSAAKSGPQWCQVNVAAEGSQDAGAKATVNVVEPLLQIAQTGPAKCLVRAEPVYEVTLTNPGTAATDAITLYAVLPEGFEYVQATDNATYSANNRAVVWKLAGLAPGANKAVSLKLRAAVAGDGLLRTIAQAAPEQPAVGPAGAGVAVRPAARVLEAKAETAIKAEGVAAVRFEVIDLDDPVEVGKEAVYEIRVTNQGTGPCTNVQLVAALADGTEYKGSSGPTQVKAQGPHLIFDPIATLAAKAEAVYRVKVRGTVAGEVRFRVQLTCDQVRTPIVKEESTRFYKE
jgi:uncharacterized repeat protein (TIGR01451 family)